MNWGDETVEDIERRIRLILDDEDLYFYVSFHLKRLSKDFLREVCNKVDLFFILTRKYIDFNKGLQEEEKVGWKHFIELYFKNCKEFIAFDD